LERSQVVRSPRFLAGIAALTLLGVAVILWVHPSQTDFAASNPYWNGLRSAYGEIGLLPLISPELLPRQPRGTALLIIPVVAPGSSELDAVSRYVHAGGILILMDDFGFGNALLERLGVGARFDGRLLVDPLFNHRSRRLPRILDLVAGPITEGVEGLVLNHATVINIEGDATGSSAVARSSPASYLDANANGQRDADEEARARVVAALARVGEGHVVLVSDPSLLLNSMLGLGGNRKFVQNIFRLAGGDARVFVDEACMPVAPLDVTKRVLLRVRAMLSYPIAAFALAGVALIYPLAALLRSSRR